MNLDELRTTNVVEVYRRADRLAVVALATALWLIATFYADPDLLAQESPTVPLVEIKVPLVLACVFTLMMYFAAGVLLVVRAYSVDRDRRLLSGDVRSALDTFPSVLTLPPTLRVLVALGLFGLLYLAVAVAYGWAIPIQGHMAAFGLGIPYVALAVLFFAQGVREEITTQQTVGPLTAEDLSTIRSSSLEFSKHMLARDFDALVQLYTDDVVFMPPNHPVVEGQDGLRKWFDSFPKASAFSLSIRDIGGYGDVAYVWGHATMTLHSEGGAGVEEAMKYVEVRKKQADGSWLLAVDLFNSDSE